MASKQEPTTLPAATTTSTPPSVPSIATDEKADPHKQDAIEYPPTRKVVLIMIGLFSSIFLISLDRTIIGTAIPTITNEFNSLDDVGWYASAYLLTMCGSQLLMGRIYTFFNMKYTFLANIIIFELGSALCGAAPTSTAFIVGRAIAGIGSAGIFSGGIPIFMYIIPLEKRPMVMGFFGLVFGFSSVIAPLIGGAFTDHVSWRWCFYINLPIGAVSMLIVAIVLQLPPRKEDKLSWKEKILSLDPIGTTLFFPSIICLLLALQWGGVQYAWSSGRVIALLVIFVVFLLGFIGVQLWRKEKATVPPRLIANRNVSAGMLFTFCTGSAMMVMVYFLPIWFQAIKGVSAVKSGIMNLPMILSLVTASLTAGFLTKKIGYYIPWMYVCAVMMPIGAGLISTFTTTTNHSKWIGYQVIFGFGLGIGMQQASVALQTVLSRKDVPTGVSCLFFCQSLGGAICSSISNNLFTNKLAQGLAGIPGLNPAIVMHIGATDLRHYVPSQALPAVLEAYNAALRSAFYVAVGTSCFVILGVLPMQWLNIHKSANTSHGGKGNVKGVEKDKDVEAAKEEVKV